MDRDKRIRTIIKYFVIIVIVLAGCITPRAIDAYKEHKQLVADYEQCVKNLHINSYGFAEARLENMNRDGKGYRDSLVLFIFAQALNAKDHYQKPEEVEAILNKIPTDYAGDCAEDIAELREFLKNEYPALYYEAKEEERRKTELELQKLIHKMEQEKRERESEQKQKKEEERKVQKQRERIAYNRKRYESSKKKKQEMPDCDDYEDYDEFMDDWDGEMPDGSDAEDYWENW